MILPVRRPETLLARPSRNPPDDVVDKAASIVDDVRRRGRAAVELWANRLDGRDPGAELIYDRLALERELDQAPPEAREILERVGGRIRRFAEAQRDALIAVEISTPGGRTGQTFSPVGRAGCYAPGGRYPLPSSVLMTAVTARVAGVESVWVASPRPAAVTLWAAAIAGVDGLLATGGAQAIAALAFGADPLPPSDVVVGPGNLWVTAAKQLVSSAVAIDLPAGPSELLIIADAGADPSLVAADLVAQAEHDLDALVILLSTSRRLIADVNTALAEQLRGLSTAAIARETLGRGAAVLCTDADEAIRIADGVAPEHLQLAVREPRALARRLRHYGALFLGDSSSAVFGDYGAGPNHVLPTAGAARRAGGLSVLSFLRPRTWIDCGAGGPDPRLVADTAWLARAEGLEGHARAAERRLSDPIDR